MQKNQGIKCLGCRTHIEKNFVFPKESLSIELKNYPFPFNDQKHKWNLLKTICSLLNSKGGTIYIGVEDSKGEVIGVSMSRKDQDDCNILIHQMVQRIKPVVDMRDEEELSTFFLPILHDGRFLGKYLIKIAVKQGDPSKLYCFSQTLQIQEPAKKTEKIELVYAYIRQNAACIDELKGYELVEEAAKKAAKPLKICHTFHDDCNPEPVCMEKEVLKIGFKHIGSNRVRGNLERWFQQYLQQMKIPPNVSYDYENDILMVELDSSKDYQSVTAFIDKHLDQLNSFLHLHFEKDQIFLDCLLYVNRTCPKDKEPQKKQRSPEAAEEETETRVNDTNSPKKRIDQAITSKPTYRKKVTDKDANGKKQISYTFTHIQPQKKKQLSNYCTFLGGSINYINSVYENTLEIYFLSVEDLEQFAIKVEGSQQIKQFGFKETIFYGRNLGIIRVNYYDRKRQGELVNYLTRKIGHELKSISPIKTGNNAHLQLEFIDKSVACQWLDNLLMDKTYKSFRMAGEGFKKVGDTKKMKTILLLERLTQVDF